MVKIGNTSMLFPWFLRAWDQMPSTLKQNMTADICHLYFTYIRSVTKQKYYHRRKMSDRYENRSFQPTSETLFNKTTFEIGY